MLKKEKDCKKHYYLPTSEPEYFAFLKGNGELELETFSGAARPKQDSIEFKTKMNQDSKVTELLFVAIREVSGVVKSFQDCVEFLKKEKSRIYLKDPYAGPKVLISFGLIGVDLFCYYEIQLKDLDGLYRRV